MEMKKIPISIKVKHYEDMVEDKIKQFKENRRDLATLKNDYDEKRETISNNLERLLEDSLNDIMKIKEHLLQISNENKQDLKTMVMEVVKLKGLKDKLVNEVSALEERTFETEVNIGFD